jgi:hypothetical protein
MRKMKLNVADLEVSSFETRAEMEARGTVAGHLNETARTEDEGSCGAGPVSCYHYNTCRPSCAHGSCAAVCGGVA